MAGKGAFFVLGVLALLVGACAPAATPPPALGATATAAPQVATPKPIPTATLAPAPTAVRFRTIRMMIVREPIPRPPIMGREWPKEAMDSAVMDTLMDLDKDGKPVPSLATKWEQRDPRTWRVYLRKGVQFQNGDSFSARDVVETVKWMIDEKKTSHAYPLVPFKDAILVDDYTVDLTFESPQPLFPIQQIYFAISPTSHAREKRDTVGRNPIGTGPYRFVRWDAGQVIELARFADYWGPKPQIDKVVITWREEPSVRLAALRVGEIDWAMTLTPEDAPKAPKSVRLTVPDRTTLLPLLDETVKKDAVLADKRLRLAIDYALDRAALVKLFGAIGATVGQGQLALPGEFGYNPNLKARPYDLQRAIALVREANAEGKTLTFISSSGKRPKDRETAEAIAYMIEQTGLKVKLSWSDPAQEREYYRVKPPDLMLVAPDFVLESQTRLRKTFYKGSTQVRFQDEQAWKLMDDAEAELDMDRRAQKVGEVYAYLYEQAYYYPLLVVQTAHGLAANLEWRPNVLGWPRVADMRFTD